MIETKKGHYLIGNNRKIFLEGKISKVYYIEEEECLIILKSK